MNMKCLMFGLLSLSAKTLSEEIDLIIISPQVDVSYRPARDALIYEIQLVVGDGPVADAIRSTPSAFSICVTWDIYLRKIVGPQCADLVHRGPPSQFPVDRIKIQGMHRFETTLNRKVHDGTFSTLITKQVPYFTINDSLLRADAPKPVLDRISMFAMCLTGELRSFSSVKPRLKLLLGANTAGTDLFVVAESYCSLERLQKQLSDLPNVRSVALQDNVTSFLGDNGNWVGKEECLLRTHDNAHVFLNDARFISQVSKLAKCYGAVEDYVATARDGVSYELIIRNRFDLLLPPEPLNLIRVLVEARRKVRALGSRSEDFLLVPYSNDNAGGLNDQFALGTPLAMHAYASQIGTYRKHTRACILHAPEGILLRTILDARRSTGLNVFRFFLDYALILLTEGGYVPVYSLFAAIHEFDGVIGVGTFCNRNVSVEAPSTWYRRRDNSTTLKIRLDCVFRNNLATESMSNSLQVQIENDFDFGGILLSPIKPIEFEVKAESVELLDAEVWDYITGNFTFYGYLPFTVHYNAFDKAPSTWPHEYRFMSNGQQSSHRAFFYLRRSFCVDEMVFMSTPNFMQHCTEVRHRYVGSWSIPLCVEDLVNQAKLKLSRISNYSIAAATPGLFRAQMARAEKVPRMISDAVEMLQSSTYSSSDNGLRILDIGGFAAALGLKVDAVFGATAWPFASEGIRRFTGSIDSIDDWGPVLDQIKVHGKYDIAICSLEYLEMPTTVLSMLGRIAKAGVIVFRSKFTELSDGQADPRLTSRRWIASIRNGQLKLYPKLYDFYFLKEGVVSQLGAVPLDVVFSWRGSPNFVEADTSLDYDSICGVYAELLWDDVDLLHRKMVGDESEGRSQELYYLV